MAKTVLSDSEWKIMQKLWEKSPLTLRQIINSLEDTSWSKHAVISFLKRLDTKNAIKVEEKKPARQYYPLLDQSMAIREEMNSVFDKFGGNIGLIGAALLDSDITADEIEELSEILKGAKKDD